jgi:glycosidase
MYLIFDGVFNHMGLNSFGFRDVVTHQQRSRFADWFEIRSWDDPARGTHFDYQGWADVKELPDLHKVGDDIAPGPKAYIFAATRRWMDPNGDGSPDDGIDGWRLDVAFCIGHQFWKDWRHLVKSINPQAYLTAEVIDPIDVLRPYLQGDEFDAVMNYNFAFACVEYFVEEKHRITTAEFDAYLRTLREAFPGGVSYVMQNLVDSHDTNRIASHIVNRNKHRFRAWADYHPWSSGENPAYDTRAPDAYARQAQKLLAIFQMTYLGAPMIYYGDEAGMWGANDPCCRKPMLWDDMTFAPEVVSPRGSPYPVAHPVAFDHDLFQHYRQLIHIRNAHPALQVGDFQTLLTGVVYAFARATPEQTVVVVLNNHDAPQPVTLQLPAARTWHDVLNHQPLNPNPDGSLSMEIPARWGRILV